MKRSPASENSACPECLEIAREIGAAYAEAYAKAGTAADALHGLIGGTDDDFERAAEFLQPYRYQAVPGLPSLPARLQAAYRRGGLHALRTGHFVRLHAAK